MLGDAVHRAFQQHHVQLVRERDDAERDDAVECGEDDRRQRGYGKRAAFGTGNGEPFGCARDNDADLHVEFPERRDLVLPARAEHDGRRSGIDAERVDRRMRQRRHLRFHAFHPARIAHDLQLVR